MFEYICIRMHECMHVYTLYIVGLQYLTIRYYLCIKFSVALNVHIGYAYRIRRQYYRIRNTYYIL